MMQGISIIGKTSTNVLEINIPDNLKNMDLQIIVLPRAMETTEEIEFFTAAELYLPAIGYLGTPLEDDENYDTW